MANVPVLSAAGATVYLKATGAGSDADPFVPRHTIDAALPAGTNNIGDTDVLSLVGDNADLDSGVGTDSHAVVAWGIPAAGGHVVGGTPTDPIRVDPVNSTVQNVALASWFAGAAVVASVTGTIFGVVNVPAGIVASVTGTLFGVVNTQSAIVASVIGTIFGVVNTQPTVVASVIGTVFGVVNVPAGIVASITGTAFNLIGGSVVASVIGTIFAVVNIPSAIVASVIGTVFAIGRATINIAGGLVTSSTIGTLYAVVNTGAVGTQNTMVGGSVNIIGGFIVASVIGTLNAAFAGAIDVAIRSVYLPLNTVASIVGFANVIATIPAQGPALNYTFAMIQVNGSGVVAANILASHAQRIIVAGYQLISTGTVILAFYDGTINAPLTGSMQLWPTAGIAVAPGKIPLMMTSSGRGLTIGLSASQNIGGAIQYIVG